MPSMKEAANEAAPLKLGSVVAMVSPAVVVTPASTPSVMMAAAAPAHMAVTMTMTALHLDDRSIGAAESIRCCDGHCRRGQGWS
jgi:hypothetical protein